jgi:hypothetical protein
MNVGIGTVAAQFLSWEYLFQIFGIVSLQCSGYGTQYNMVAGRSELTWHGGVVEGALIATKCCK